ncbi:MAG: hydantoinase B/oxoprolinase family protein [Hyphomicrobiales bacterium]
MAWGIGCDIGGTFTDLLMINDETGQVEIQKVLTTSTDPSEAIETGLRGLQEAATGCISGTDMLVHGTTLVINSVIERKGAKTGLITTRGFRDVLEIGREKRYDGVDLQITFPEPLVPRPLRMEVDERIHVSGKVLKPLDELSVEKAVRQLLEQGVQSIAVCLLHSYSNPEHEVRIGKVIARIAPDIPVSLSHEVLREMKEYERSSTTAVNAYAKPVVSRYLRRLESRLDDLDFKGELLLMQSSGGLNSAEAARDFPVQIIESGPAAGVIAAAHYAELTGHKMVLAFDMGGTTAKMCVVKDGRIARTNEIEVDRVHRFKRGSGLPVRIPIIDLMEIGAGGGSIAKVSVKGTLEVGPESASSSPGPACYGRGGVQPTVSDADLVLGYLNPDYFLGAKMGLDKAAAESAIEMALARPLKLSVTEAAWGIHSVVNENMASASKVYVAEKGYDPASCAVVAFGGAGPVHATDLARRIGAKTVIVPPRAGVASAFGMLVAPVTADKVQTHRTVLSLADFDTIEREYRTLETDSAAALPRSIDRKGVKYARFADMRYVGQGYEVTIPVPEGKVSAQSLRESFNEAYILLYGRVFDELELEIINLRVTAVAEGRKFKDTWPAPDAGSKPSFTEREAFCAVSQKMVPHKVYRRGDLVPGVQIKGPAIIEEAESTTIVGSADSLTVDGHGTLVVTMGQVAKEASAGAEAREEFDPALLEMLWRRLVSSVDELSAALVRTSFSTVVRDVKDYACAIFDAEGRLLAQSSDSTPGIAGGCSAMLPHMLEQISPKDLKPGDVLIGNNPWHGSGHHNDIFTITPAFHENNLIGYAACAAHHVDIGGRRSTTESRDNYEEGLRIPVCKIMVEGKPNPDVFAFIAANVRLPETVQGDLRAQMSANYVGCERLRELCVERGWKTFQPLADEIIERSRRLTEAEIGKIPNGVYRHQAPIAKFDGQEVVLKVAVTVKDKSLTVDFSGSSPQVKRAVNCTITYTRGYTNFAVSALLRLPLGCNEGTLSPISIVAEEGTVANARFPAPVFARTSIGNFLPEMVFTAMANAVPDRIVAPSGATPLWAQYIFGTRKDGTKFAPLNSASGGLGARADRDGVSCLTFPVNIGNSPAEVLESEVPLIVRCRQLWQGSAGPGRFRGGLGQIFEVEVLDGDLGPDGPLLVGFRGGRFFHAVPGILGGGDGPKGVLTINGTPAYGGGDESVPPGGMVRCEIPGGGGLGDPRERDPELIRRDIAFGYITPEQAREQYGYEGETGGRQAVQA